MNLELSLVSQLPLYVVRPTSVDLPISCLTSHGNSTTPTMVTMPVSELPSVPVKEGTIPFAVGGETFSTWYKLFGVLEGRGKRPLVILHGGPGLTHDYLLPLADLGTDRPVILYDQIGNGHSSRAADQPASIWTIDLMIDELVNLLRHFDIEDDFDVLGHSWGAQMLSEYLIRRSPAGLKRAVFTNPASNIADYEKTRIEQVMLMPEWVQEAMKKGFSDTPEFRRALEFYMSVHVCRVSPLPEDVLRSVDYGLKDSHVSDILYAFTDSFLVHRILMCTQLCRRAQGLEHRGSAPPHLRTLVGHQRPIRCVAGCRGRTLLLAHSTCQVGSVRGGQPYALLGGPRALHAVGDGFSGRLRATWL
jgi:proline-specific peptidase